VMAEHPDNKSAMASRIIFMIANAAAHRRRASAASEGTAAVRLLRPSGAAG
jgi:hypothetical protein